jgi:uncharacterized protein YndB with AHSA1/START domain
MDIHPIGPFLEPVRKSLRVSRTPGEAFDLFTSQIGRWWPLLTHSVSTTRAVNCVIEPRVGGAVYEVRDDGIQVPWGTVVAWEPPHRFVVTWHPGRPADTAQELEVCFTDDAGTTRVDLEHRGWQTYGPDAERARSDYENGWKAVLASLTRFAERPV